MQVVCLVMGVIVSTVFILESLLTGALDFIQAALTEHNFSVLRELMDETMPSLVGLLSASAGFLGAGFILPNPIASIVFYVIAGLLSVSIGEIFPDARIWGYLYFGLAAFAIFIWRRLESR